MRIKEEGSSCEIFDPMSWIKKWSIDQVRCATDEKESLSCKSRNSAQENVKSLSDDDSYGEEEIISEHWDDEGYLFSCNSE